MAVIPTQLQKFLVGAAMNDRQRLVKCLRTADDAWFKFVWLILELLFNWKRGWRLRIVPTSGIEVDNLVQASHTGLQWISESPLKFDVAVDVDYVAKLVKSFG